MDSDNCPHCKAEDLSGRGIVHRLYHQDLADPPYDYDPIEHTWRPEVNALRARVKELEHQLAVAKGRLATCEACGPYYSGKP